MKYYKSFVHNLITTGITVATVFLWQKAADNNTNLYGIVAILFLAWFFHMIIDAEANYEK